MITHWWNDHYRCGTLHRNEPSLTHKESMLGSVYEDDDGWYYNVVEGNTTVGPHRNADRARRALEAAVGAEALID